MVSMRTIKTDIDKVSKVGRTLNLSMDGDKPVVNTGPEQEKFPLVCYTFEGEKWVEKKFPLSKKAVRLGTSQDCDVKFTLADIDDAELSFKFYGNAWIVLNTKKCPDFQINGISSNQNILFKDGCCYVQVGGNQYIFSTKKAKSKSTKEEGDEEKEDVVGADKNANTGPAQSGEYSLKTPFGQFRYPFSQSILIGQHQVCDIRVAGAEFAGIISSSKGKLYFHPIFMQDFSINQAIVSGSTHLYHESNIKTGQVEMTLEIAEDMRDIPDEKGAESDYFCLLGLTEEGKFGDKIVLPTAGQSVFVGRSDISDYVVLSEQVSRKHAQLIIYDTSILLMDCYSTNGTFVNGEQVGKKRCYLGDILTFGDKSFLFCYYSF